MEESDTVEAAPPPDTVDVPPPGNNAHPYSESEIDLINNIAEEASDLFPEGKQFSSPAELCKEVRSFAHRKGFAVSTHSTKVICKHRVDGTTTLEEVVNDHLSVFCQTTKGQQLFSQQTSMTQESSDYNGVLPEMRRGAPPVAANQFSKKRKKISQ